MAKKVMANLPFKLDGSKNTRDLGGYPTKYGGYTAVGQFLRSDNPGHFTDDDKKRLVDDYGVGVVCDLRSDSEAATAPCALIDYKNVKYHQFQMVAAGPGGKLDLPESLGEMYIQLIDRSQERYLGVFKAMLEHPDDCVFFNCTVGKDRTGTTAMLLLKLAGVSTEHILIDYKATAYNIRDDVEKLIKFYKERGNDLDPDFLDSKPHHMEKAIKHIDDTYGSIENWMKKVGLSDDEIGQLRNKLLGK